MRPRLWCLLMILQVKHIHTLKQWIKYSSKCRPTFGVGMGKRNKLALNVSKTNSMVFGSNHTISRNPESNIRIDKECIKQVQETRLLGVIIDSKLSWTKHIHKTVVKMDRGISIIRRCVTKSNQTSNSGLNTVKSSLLPSCLVQCLSRYDN